MDNCNQREQLKKIRKLRKFLITKAIMKLKDRTERVKELYGERHTEEGFLLRIYL